MNDPFDRLSAGLIPPAPPLELRARTLAAAHSAVNCKHSSDVWYRLWTSWPLRIAWAAAVAGLLVGNLLVGADTPSAPPGPLLPVAAAAGGSGELAEVAELGRLTVELPGWEIAAASNPGSNRERTSS